MSQSASAPRPERPVARLFELRGRDRREAIEIVQRALSDAGYEPRDCVEVLGGAFVSAAVRRYWVEGLSPAEAHERLRVEDPELARATKPSLRCCWSTCDRNPRSAAAGPRGSAQ